MFPDLGELFRSFDQQYFEGKLQVVEVKWSSRMTLCAGLCCFSKREGFCSIRLSEPLLQYRPVEDFVCTLLHEMIHAFLFITSKNRDRDGHGLEFQYHMHRINLLAKTNITIYHSFHDEVNNFRKHVWRCNGSCSRQPPFYGFVKRAMNRAPQKADWWWSKHQINCNGEFIKISEPQKIQAKKKRKGDDKNFQLTLKTNKDKEVILIDDENDFAECPICSVHVESSVINDHLDSEHFI